MTERALEPLQTAGAVPGRAVSAPAARSLVALPAAGHELLAVAGRRVPAMQATLEVGSVDDPLEREADRVADRVMRMPEPGALRRTCACGGEPGLDGECARCRAKRLGLQRKPAAGAIATVAPPIVHEALSSPGAPLEPATRAFFQPRLGADLSHVRVHHDDRAAASARAVGALAYTVGSEIVFADGRYAPGTGAGRRLMAHELAHVLQQRSGDPLLQRQTKPTCNAIEYDPNTEQCCNGQVTAGPSVVGGPACPNLTTRDIEYDGCSVPDKLLVAGQDKDNPAGFPDTEFSDKRIHGHWDRSFVPQKPCDVHDKCFQTCGTDVRDCDRQLMWDAQAVCRNAKLSLTDYRYCLDNVDYAMKWLALGSWKVHMARQRDYCACCGGTPPPVPAKISVPLKFATGKSTLDKGAKAAVDDFVTAHRTLLQGVNYDLTLIGQASRLGSDADNLSLSQQRLAAVRARIEERLGMAIPGTVLEEPLGATLATLEVPADPADDSQEYRSVEIILVGPK